MSKKELNFEINILPILDILSVLICFLLLTAVWLQLSTVDVKQAVGDNAAGGKNPPSIWATVGADGSIALSLRDVKTSGPRELRVAGNRAAIDFDRLGALVKDLKAKIPDLKTGIIRAQASTNYGDVIRVMDELRRGDITDVGLSPLSEGNVL